MFNLKTKLSFLKEYYIETKITTIETPYQIEKETEKAYLFYFPEYEMRLWLPKKFVDISGEHLKINRKLYKFTDPTFQKFFYSVIERANLEEYLKRKVLEFEKNFEKYFFDDPFWELEYIEKLKSDFKKIAGEISNYKNRMYFIEVFNKSLENIQKNILNYFDKKENIYRFLLKFCLSHGFVDKREGIKKLWEFYRRMKKFFANTSEIFNKIKEKIIEILKDKNFLKDIILSKYENMWDALIYILINYFKFDKETIKKNFPLIYLEKKNSEILIHSPHTIGIITFKHLIDTEKDKDLIEKLKTIYKNNPKIFINPELLKKL